MKYIDPDLPLFVHQYSHAWFDFRGRRDGYADYFRNSQIATAAHRQFCAGLAGRFPWFGPTMWGITASDSRSGAVWDAVMSTAEARRGMEAVGLLPARA